MQNITTATTKAAQLIFITETLDQVINTLNITPEQLISSTKPSTTGQVNDNDTTELLNLIQQVSADNSTSTINKLLPAYIKSTLQQIINLI
jgi:hypothetical protein